MENEVAEATAKIPLIFSAMISSQLGGGVGLQYLESEIKINKVGQLL
jgi:hypothetical protein